MSWSPLRLFDASPMLAGALVKFAAESAWCYLGLRMFRAGDPTGRGPSTVRYGLVRLLIGRLLALAIESVSIGRPEWLIYFALVIPLRSLAWFLVGKVLSTREVRLLPFWGTDRRLLRWLIGGVAVSCAADLAVLLAGVPVARLWP